MPYTVFLRQQSQQWAHPTYCRRQWLWWSPEQLGLPLDPGKCPSLDTGAGSSWDSGRCPCRGAVGWDLGSFPTQSTPDSMIPSLCSFTGITHESLNMDSAFPDSCFIAKCFPLPLPVIPPVSSWHIVILTHKIRINTSKFTVCSNIRLIGCDQSQAHSWPHLR